MVIKLIPFYSFLWINCEASINKIFGFAWNLNTSKIWPFIFYLFENIIIIHSHIRIFSINHLVVNNTNWPDIGLKPIRLLIKDLWSHCKTCSQDSLSHSFFLHLFGKTQISNFTNTIMQQNIGSFEVTMHCTNLMQPLNIKKVSYFKTVQNLFNKHGSLILGKTFFLFQILL